MDGRFRVRLELEEAREMAGDRVFKCYACGNEWQEPYGTGRPAVCPKCGSPNMHRTDADRRRGRGQGGRGAGRGAPDDFKGRGMSNRNQR